MLCLRVSECQAEMTKSTAERMVHDASDEDITTLKQFFDTMHVVFV